MSKLDKLEAKKLLRKELTEALKGLSQSEYESLSQRVSKNIINLISQLKSKHSFDDGLKVGCFGPILKEPLWFLAFDGSEADQFLMVHMHKEIKLSFHPVELEEIKNGTHGLELELEYLKTQQMPDVILVPGLGFNKKCERIGRGKGYYDSYLENFKGITIGIAFERQLVDDVCREEHDQNLDYLITEDQTYKG